MLSTRLLQDTSYYTFIQQSRVNPNPTGAGGPTGTNIAIVSGSTVIPYTNSTSQSPTNSPCWQMFYANQTTTFTQIKQYTYTNGTNSWTYYISIAPSAGSQSFAGATVSSIGSANTSYTSGGVTSTNVTSQTVNAGYYFLVGCVTGPYYKTFNASPSSYIFTLSGNPKVTMVNSTYWKNHGAADQTMNIPTQLGGSGTYNAPANTIWCLDLGGIS